LSTSSNHAEASKRALQSPIGTIFTQVHNSIPIGHNGLPEAAKRNLLLALLNGDLQPDALSESQAKAILAEAALQGIEAQLWARWKHRSVRPAWTSGLADRVRLQTQWELSHSFAIADLLGRFAGHGVETLILKGTALAYDVYGHPADRVRGDTDLLIDANDCGRADAVLRDAGFGTATPMSQIATDQTQLSYTRIDRGGARQCIDLHWAPINSPLLDRVWNWTDLRTRAVALPGLAAQARTLGRVDASLHACLHWAINRHVPYHFGGTSRVGGNRLIWLYDIHLLARSLTVLERAELIDRATAKGIAGLCRKAIESTAEYFPDAALAALADGLQAGQREWLTLALSGSWLRRAFAELLALRSPGRQWRYLRGHLWADESSLQRRYPDSHSPIWRLQLRRWVDGLKARAGR
jgi:hypothetical protein